MRTAARAVLLGLALAAGASLASAQENLRPLCPDRPGKGTSPCTVDPGHVQIEVDAVDFTRQKQGPATTDAWVVAAPTLKLGVTRTLDLEAGFDPVDISRTSDRISRAHSTVEGLGDLFLRAKLNFAGDDGGPVGLALEPYLKAPTASHDLGNGAWEGGVLAPVSISLPRGFSLGLTPELDVLENIAGDGRHVALVLPVGITGQAGPVAATLEFWTSQSFDRPITVRQYSIDLAGAWQPGRNVQLDGGVNFGLNRATPDLQVYLGVTRRF